MIFFLNRSNKLALKDASNLGFLGKPFEIQKRFHVLEGGAQQIIENCGVFK